MNETTDQSTSSIEKWVQLVEEGKGYTGNDYYDSQVNQIEDILQRHGAEVQVGSVGSDVVKRLTFRRPESSPYLIRYELTGGRMVVTGDVGPGQYAFGHSNFETIAGYGPVYFAEKLRASRDGHRGKQWNGEHGRKILVSHLWDHARGKYDGHADSPEEAAKSEVLEKICNISDAGGFDRIIDKDEWYLWVRDNYQVVMEGPFPYWLPEVGEVHSTEVLYHHTGLRLAVEVAHEMGVDFPLKDSTQAQ